MPKLKTLNDEGEPAPLKKKHRVTIAEDLQEKCICMGMQTSKVGKICNIYNPEGRLHFCNPYIIEVMQSVILMTLSWLPSMK